MQTAAGSVLTWVNLFFLSSSFLNLVVLFSFFFFFFFNQPSIGIDSDTFVLFEAEWECGYNNNNIEKKVKITSGIWILILQHMHSLIIDLTRNGLSLRPSLISRTNKDYFLFISYGIYCNEYSQLATCVCLSWIFYHIWLVNVYFGWQVASGQFRCEVCGNLFSFSDFLI